MDLRTKATELGRQAWSEERTGRDDDAEGLCVKVGSTHPGRQDRPAGTAVLTGCSDRRVQWCATIKTMLVATIRSH